MIFNKFLWLLVIAFLLFYASVSESAPPTMPARIGGTVVVNGTQITRATDEGYTFVVTDQSGSPSFPAAEDTDGLNLLDSYVIDIPIYDAGDQPEGMSPGDTAVIHVYKDGIELDITSPNEGKLLVGHSGSTTVIHITVSSPTWDDTAPSIENYPSIDHAGNTIDVTFSEGEMQNATHQANYNFSPSLNFAGTGEDITNPFENVKSNTPHYRRRLQLRSTTMMTMIWLTTGRATGMWTTQMKTRTVTA